MKSITIHNLDDELARRIKQKSEVTGSSLNKTIKQLLRASLGIDEIGKKAKAEQLKEFFGVWSKKEGAEIEKALKDFERIDKEDWE